MAGRGRNHDAQNPRVVDRSVKIGCRGIPGDWAGGDRAAAGVGLEYKAAPGRCRLEQDRAGRHLGDGGGATGEPVAVDNGQRRDWQRHGQEPLAHIDPFDRKQRAVGRFERLRADEIEPGGCRVGRRPQAVENGRQVGVGRRIHLPVDIVLSAVDQPPDRLTGRGPVCHGGTIGNAGIEGEDDRVHAIDAEDRHRSRLWLSLRLGRRHGELKRRAGRLHGRIGRPGLGFGAGQLERARRVGIDDRIINSRVGKLRHRGREALDVGQCPGVGDGCCGCRVGKRDRREVGVEGCHFEPSPGGRGEKRRRGEPDRLISPIEQLQAGGPRAVLGRQKLDPVTAIGQAADQLAAGVLEAHEPAGHLGKAHLLAIDKRRPVGPGGRIELEHVQHVVGVALTRDGDDRERALRPGGKRGKARAERDRPAVGGVGGREGEPQVAGIGRIDDRVVGVAIVEARDGRAATGRIHDRLAGDELRGRRQSDRAVGEIDRGCRIKHKRRRWHGLPRLDGAPGENLDDRTAHGHGRRRAHQAIFERRCFGLGPVDVGAGGPYLHRRRRLDERRGREVHRRLRVLNRDRGRKGDVTGIDRLEAGVEVGPRLDRGRVVDPRGQAHAAAGRFNPGVLGDAQRRNGVAVGEAGGEADLRIL